MTDRTLSPGTEAIRPSNELLIAAQHCLKIFESMADRGRYPEELIYDSPHFLGKQGWKFLTDAIRDTPETPDVARDAERYRWLVGECGASMLQSYFSVYDVKDWRGVKPALDKAVDAGIERESPTVKAAESLLPTEWREVARSRGELLDTIEDLIRAEKLK
jgi:hypothetical protein